ncbi:MAG: hypothetical protein L0241_30750 [Planctomycetia bacterium]|nr:hypothetical protein [Planctomycetia bacterium]
MNNGRSIKALCLKETGELSPSQEQAALALAAGKKIAAAAKLAEVGVSTVKEWLYTIPEFPARVRELREEMTKEAIGKIVDGLGFAAVTLRNLMDSENPNAALGAARAMFEIAFKVKEGDLGKEIAELRTRINAITRARTA